MGKKVLQERKRLAAIFASFAILVMGTASLIQSMSLDYYSVINTLQKIIPASVIMGGLGWVMGMILDQPRRRSRLNYGNMLTHGFLKHGEHNSAKSSVAIDEEAIEKE